MPIRKCLDSKIGILGISVCFKLSLQLRVYPQALPTLILDGPKRSIHQNHSHIHHIGMSRSGNQKVSQFSKKRIGIIVIKIEIWIET